jgi:hypothetical protein
MSAETMSDTELLRALALFERLYTVQGLKTFPSYQTLLREAVNRSLHTENLTEQEMLIRIESEGPDMNRPG